jgi:transcriptional regulator with XRE-family HTH domain
MPRMNNIKQLRKQKGLSVTELANRLNMSQSNLTKIENNQLDLKPDVARRIAEILNISSTALLPESPAENSVTTNLPLLNPETLSLPPLTKLPFFLNGVGNKAEITACCVAGDDAMSPTLKKGDFALLTQSFETPQNGVYAIFHHGQHLIRRLQYLNENEVLFLSDNQFYQPVKVATTDFLLNGRVVVVSHTAQL